MPTHKPGKLMINAVGRHRGDLLVEVSKTAGARGGTISLGRSIKSGAILQALFLADVQQDVVFTLMGDEADGVIEAVQRAAKEQPKKLGGTQLILDVSGMYLRVAPTVNIDSVETRSAKMESGFQLIWVIINQGYADDVMQAARKAGAKGGTIITARGTGTEDDVKFFGISLVPEKEMLLIVADNSATQGIVEAINATPHLCEPGGGIVFNMNVEQFTVLGK